MVKLRWIALVGVKALIALSLPHVAQAQSGSSQDATTTTTIPVVSDQPGLIAYATAAGEVVVADGNGSNPKVIGTGAVANARGLTPLAWTRPAGEAITYVRNDGALVNAAIDGSGQRVLATDAVVPQNAASDIISWEFSGTFVVYLSQPKPGQIEPAVLDFSGAEPDKPIVRRTIGNPAQREVFRQFFAPLDPFIVQLSRDRETQREFTPALVEPAGGTILGLPTSINDPTISPDGRWAFGVAQLDGVEQLVRISYTDVIFQPLYNATRICHPSVSPNAAQIVFAAGPECEDVWLINTNGGAATQLSKRRAGTATFEVGEFTWSLDSKTVSHPYCERRDADVACGGRYWDISTDGTSVLAQADATNVVRELRTLIRPIRMHVDIRGGIRYDGLMEVGSKSVGDLIPGTIGEQYTATAVDEGDISRDVKFELTRPETGEIISGTIAVRDGDQQFKVEFFGKFGIASFGYGRIRGVWTDTTTFPMRSGAIIITVER